MGRHPLWKSGGFDMSPFVVELPEGWKGDHVRAVVFLGHRVREELEMRYGGKKEKWPRLKLISFGEDGRLKYEPFFKDE